jgi:RHS repeat-associated protein
VVTAVAAVTVIAAVGVAIGTAEHTLPARKVPIVVARAPHLVRPAFVQVSPAVLKLDKGRRAKPATRLQVSAHLPSGTVTLVTPPGAPHGAPNGARHAAASGTPQVGLAPAPLTPPFTECPPVGLDTSCGILVDITDSGISILSDSTQGPYEGSEDTLTGVVNQSSGTVGSLALSSNTNLFQFDGDGICTQTPQPAGCPFGSTGYEGPGTSFSNISADTSGGEVDFTPGLASGATAYFALEESLVAAQVFGGGPSVAEQGGAPNQSEKNTSCFGADPVNCATGRLITSATDAAIPGRGVGLSFARTYDSGAATVAGPLGFGWTDSYAASLSVDPTSHDVIVHQENGAAVTFIPTGSGTYIAPPRVLATLVGNPDGSFAFTRRKPTVRFDFSAAGVLLDEVDRNGYATTLTYSGGQLTSVTDPAGRTLTFTYTGSQVASMTDPLGRTTAYAYTPAGDLASVTDAAGRTVSYSYDASHRMLTSTDARGGVTTTGYDSSGRVTNQQNPAGQTTTFGYTGDNTSIAGGTTTITDPHGNVTVQSYTSLEVQSITSAAGTAAAATTSFTYDPATLGQNSIIDPNGNPTTSTFDGDGNVLTTTDPLGRTTSYSYNSFDEVTQTVSPAGEVSSATYDAQGNILSSSDPTGQTTNYTYADLAHPGDLTSVTDPDGRIDTLTYDGFGDEASRTTNPAAGVFDTAEMTYDGDGERVCQASAATVGAGVHCPALNAARVPGTSTWVYDNVGQVVNATDANGAATGYTYDAAGNQTKVTDATGNTRAWTFDALGREATVATGPSGSASVTTYAYDIAPGTSPCTGGVAGATYCTSTTDPDGHTTVDYLTARDLPAQEVKPGHTTSYHYDLADNLAQSIDAAGRTTTMTYDAANELVGVSYSDGATHGVAYSYDADGRRTSMTDGTGTTTYAYDADSRYASVTGGNGAVVGYTYDGAGDITTLTYPSGHTVVNGYDGAGRLTSVRDWAGHTTGFQYNADNNLTNTTYPNGDAVTATYDPADRMTATALTGTTTLAAISYSRNPIGLLSQESDSAALTGATSFGYDLRNELATAGGSTFGYDPSGRLTTLSGGGGSTRSYTPDDQLASVTTKGVTTTYGFDAVGDRTSASAAGTTSYGYDQEGRLTSVSRAAPLSTPCPGSGVHASAVCLPTQPGHVRLNGRPGQAATGPLTPSPVAVSVIATYQYDGDGLRTSRTVNATSTSFVWDRGPANPLLLGDGAFEYVYGPAGSPIEQLDHSGNASYYFRDQLGSTRALIGPTGGIVATASYDAYGSLSTASGTLPAFLYAGGYRDAETGLYYLTHRYYDPTTAQFLTVDPFRALTRSSYGYTPSNPVNFTDPSGLCVSVLDWANLITDEIGHLGELAEFLSKDASTLARLLRTSGDAAVRSWAASLLKGTSAMADLKGFDFLRSVSKGLGIFGGVLTGVDEFANGEGVFASAGAGYGSVVGGRFGFAVGCAVCAGETLATWYGAVFCPGIVVGAAYLGSKGGEWVGKTVGGWVDSWF